MIDMGLRNKCFGLDDLTRFRALASYELESGRPTRMPQLPGKWNVIAGWNRGLGEQMFICETLEDMQRLYDAYRQGLALRLNWYAGHDVGFVQCLDVSGSHS